MWATKALDSGVLLGLCFRAKLGIIVTYHLSRWTCVWSILW